MAGNAWQWVGDIIPGSSDRFMHGGSKDNYDMDLRIWVRNSAIPTYYTGCGIPVRKKSVSLYETDPIYLENLNGTEIHLEHPRNKN